MNDGNIAGAPQVPFGGGKNGGLDVLAGAA